MPKFSILIIEDEKNIQTFMRKILIRHDYRVLCADAGTEWLSHLQVLNVLILSFLISDFPI